MVVINLDALNAMKKDTLLENAPTMMEVHLQEKLAASNVAKRVILQEIVHKKEKIILERDKEMTMVTKMEVDTRDKDQMMRTTRITNGERIGLKHNFNQV